MNYSEALEPIEPTGKGRILTIDDEPDLRQSFVAYLEDSGFEMFEACNGREGIEKFRELQPDLILSDLRMPEMDGMEVVRTVTAESPETPVIVVSGNSMIQDAIEAVREGAWDYLVKPVSDMAILEQSVVRGIERSRLMKQNRVIRENLERMVQELAGKLSEKAMEIETLFETSTLGICVVDARLNIVRLNRAFRSIMLPGCGPVKGKSIVEVMASSGAESLDTFCVWEGLRNGSITDNSGQRSTHWAVGDTVARLIAAPSMTKEGQLFRCMLLAEKMSKDYINVNTGKIFLGDLPKASAQTSPAMA